MSRLVEKIKASGTFRRLAGNRMSLAGLLIIVFFVFLALAAPLLAPAEKGINPYLMPQSGYIPDPSPPDKAHIFGTAEQQYDLFHGIVWGTRTAFKVGVTVAAASLIIGILLGAVAGFYGRWVDGIFMRATDIVLAFPGMVLAVIIVSMLGPGLEKVMIAIAAVSWPAYARLVRGNVLSVKERDFVTAARALGAGSAGIFFRHILPNSVYPVIIMASLDIGTVVLTAAALSFLGLGAPPGYSDWGRIIAMSRNWIMGNPGDPFAFWHTVLIPGAAIFLFVLGWNLAGDAFRDILDPRQE
ncbi:MAG: ABC transporter permease [bacterium]